MRSMSPVRQSKALYVGLSSYNADDTRTMAGLLRDLGTPLLIHQPSYSMLNRWIETEGRHGRRRGPVEGRPDAQRIP